MTHFHMMQSSTCVMFLSSTTKKRAGIGSSYVTHQVPFLATKTDHDFCQTKEVIQLICQLLQIILGSHILLKTLAIPYK